MPLPSTFVEQNKVDANWNLAGQILANSQVILNSSVNVIDDNFVVPLNSAEQPPAAVLLQFARIEDAEDKIMRQTLLHLKVYGCPPSNFPKLPLKDEDMSNY